MQHRPRVAVLASKQLTGMGLSTYLESSADIEVLPAAQAAAADVLVVGADALDSRLVMMLRRLTSESDVRSVLVTRGLAEPELPVAAECRVIEVLPHTTTCDTLVRAVREAARWSGPGSGADLAARLCLQLSRFDHPGRADTALGSREVDVLRLVAEGLETTEIASRLWYSERTVRNVLDTVRRRLRLNNRSHTVAYALRAGLI